MGSLQNGVFSSGNQGHYTNKKIEMRTGTQYLISVLYVFWLKLRAFYSLFFSPVSSGLGRVTGGRSGTPDRPCSPCWSWGC